MLRRSLLAAFAATLLLPAAAHAAVTQTAITTPAADGAVLSTVSDGVNPETTVPVAGTSNGTSGDQIQVRCYRAPDRYTTLVNNVPVAADGTWATTVSDGYPGCKLYAVPTGASGDEPDPAQFQPRRVKLNRLERYVSNGILEGGAFYTTGERGYLDAFDMGDCGVCDMALFDPTQWRTGEYLFYSNQGVYRSLDGKRAYAQVDGRDAFSPYAQRSVDMTMPGRLAIQFDAQDARTLDTTEPLAICTAQTTSPPSGVGQCGSFTSSGVDVVRTLRLSEDGRTAVVTDRFRSTDGKAHTVDVLYDQAQDSDTSDQLRYRFDWLDPAFTPGGGAPVAGGTGPTTVTIQRDKDVPNGSLEQPVGALTMSPSPVDIRWRLITNKATFYTHYVLQIPAGGEQTVVGRFDMSDSLAELDARAAAARDQLEGPSLAIASPANGSTTATPSLTISGTASDNGGTPVVRVDGTVVRVDGTVVPVGAGGAWSTTLPATNGPRTITVTATDGQGNVATRTTAVTVAIPATPDTTAPRVTLTLPSKATAAAVRRSGLRARIRCTEACRVRGEMTGAVRSFSIRASAGSVVLATRSLGLGTGTRSLTLKPSSKLGRALRKGRTVTVVVTATDAAGNTRTATKRLKLR